MIKVSNNRTISLDALFPHKDTSGIDYIEPTINDDQSVTLRFINSNTGSSELKPKKFKCTKNLVRMVKETTNACWFKANTEFSSIGHPVDREAVDARYLELVLRSPTDVLEAVILCHNKGKMKRAKKTLECINNEIARRVLLNDYTSQK